MLSLRHRRRGFTLIELMVTIALVALLLLAGIPAFGTWVADASVRSAADELQNALRLAQSTAVARSRTAVLALTTATPAWDATPAENAPNWFVRVLPLSESDETVTSSNAATYYVQGSRLASQNSVSITGPALLCFNAMGRQVTKPSTATGMSAGCEAPSDDATTPIAYTVSRSNASRKLKVLVYLGGRVRMCDAAKTLSNDDPDGCPA